MQLSKIKHPSIVYVTLQCQITQMSPPPGVILRSVVTL